MKISLRLAFILLLFQDCRLSASLIFVSAGSHNPTPPYAMWATAATNIQNALDLAGANDMVLVTNGTYSGGLLVGKPLILVSVNGPLFTSIDGGGTNRCITISNRTWMQGFTLTNGWTSTDGGGVWSTPGSAFLTNCIFSGNCASNGGGAFQANLFNCALTGNCASNGVGGGAYFSGLYNCTVAGNSAATGGGAFNSSLYNSIIYYNTATNGSNYAQVSVINNCCTTPDPGIGVSNITSAPLFVDYAAGNLRLQPTSPCIDAGNNFVPRSELDPDGNPRFSGHAIDIGAYEFNPLLNGPPSFNSQPLSQGVVPGTNVTLQVVAFGKPPMIWQWWFNHVEIANATNSSLTLSAVTTNQAGNYFVVVTNSLGAATSQVAVLTVLPGVPPFITLQPVSQTVPAGTSVTFTAAATGLLPLSWQWLFNGNPIKDATNSNLTLSPVTVGQSGDYAVTVTNLAGITVSTIATLLVQASGTKYVWQNSPNPTAPYITWATAAHTIQDAVDASVTNDAVLVTNGTYVGGVTVSHPLTLQSVNGPQVTVIDGGSTNEFSGSSCVYMTSDANISGFTLTNGYAAQGLGGGASGSYANTDILTNCIITGNRAYFTGGGAARCTLYNCTLTSNWGETNGGAAVNSTLYNCTLTRNSGDTNYFTGAAVYACNLYNCTIISNSLAAADSCTLYGCTVTGNQRGGALGSALYNCIAYYNNPSPWVPGYPNYTGITGTAINYCCTTPMPSGGVGNITNEPLFVDPANRDFHLQPGSPCINGGSNAYAFGTDLDGNPRIIDVTVDIGAYESPHVPQIRFVWQQSPSLTPPYTSWATAATNIQDALSASLAGDTILVTNGTYVGGVTVTHPLTLQSVNGPQATVIDGGSTNEFSGSSCVYMTSDGAVSGFTLTHGNSTFGGGVGGYGGNHFLTNCVLTGNRADLGGGGAAWCTLYSCYLTGNWGETNGEAAINSTLYNCTLSRNSGNASGAAAYGCNLYNCAIFDNLLAAADTCTLYNCTLTGNQGGGAGGSVLYNCIAYYNVSPQGSRYANYAGGTLNYCCTIPMPSAGIGNITNEPVLAADWRLSSSSPCRGAGSAGYSSRVDLDGQPWLNPPSIGCDEFYSGSVTGALTVAAAASWTNVPTGFTVNLDGTIAGRVSAYRWEFGDGTVESNRLHTSHQWLTPGDYGVVLRAYNDDYPAGVTATLTVRVLTQAPVHYVDMNSPGPVAPYGSWSTAARNIQDALVAVSAPNAVVLATNGTYAGGLTVTKPVTLMSVNGPRFTVISGGGTNRCLSWVTNASLSGFTLTNGSASIGGGVWCGPQGVYLTNCVLAGNSSSGAGGGTSGGTLYNCVLSGNSASDSGGGALDATLYNCTLAGNSAYAGGGAIFSTLYNCTLVGNSALAYGGGADASTLDNCIVYFNSPLNYANCALNSCCTTPLPGNGAGHISKSPLFVNQAGGDFRLRPTSPCINAGNNSYVSEATDLDGNPRIVGGTVDIGAYEFQGAGPAAFYAWLQSYSLPNDGSADYADSDGDGFNNWQEWVSGTDPTNSLSCLRLLSATPTATNAIAVSWQSVSGLNYFLERSANLTSPFTVLTSNIVGQAAVTSFADTNASSLGPFFYRVGVAHP